MRENKVKRYGILGILFFLPVTFLLFLYPAQHNYVPLDIINEDVLEVSGTENLQLEGHITVLAFFGKNPMDKVIAASNLKELVYDNFKGFKKFQVLAIAPESSKQAMTALIKEIQGYDELKYWHTVYKSEAEINRVFSSLKSHLPLNNDLATDQVFIIDKDRNQRGRFDDRTDNEKEQNTTMYGLSSYDCIEVSEIKNKMSDDMRILFTEYRQKRKGDFDSSSRRANELK